MMMMMKVIGPRKSEMLAVDVGTRRQTPAALKMGRLSKQPPKGTTPAASWLVIARERNR